MGTQRDGSVDVDPSARASDRTTVAEVMVADPKVLSEDATVAQVRAALEDDHVHMVLLTRDALLCGTVIRGDVPDSVSDAQEAIRFAHLGGRTVSATMPAHAALQRLVARQQRRLAVVDDRGMLIGLLCLKRRGNGFCSERDVAARAQERLADCRGRHGADGLARVPAEDPVQLA